MGKVQALVHSLNVAEVSQSGLARVDQARNRLAFEVFENVIPFVIGKGQVRPGFQYIASAEGNNQARLIAFPSSGEGIEDAILVLTNGKLRVLIDDAYVTRPSVTSSVTNGDFSSGTGWTLTVSDGAAGNINSTLAGHLYMQAQARGSSVTCTRSVTTSNGGTLHALRIDVLIGPVVFRCGSTSGGDDYIAETELETGLHSLAFTPSGTYHVFFKTQRETAVYVNSIQVESAGVMEITAPWTAAQLRGIREAQSEDVMFMAHNSWQQRRIERRGDGENSWSIVLYKTDDGPFTLAKTAKVRLTPSGTSGNVTLTADGSFFRPTHVGTLFRLSHEPLSAAFSLAGEIRFTDAIRVAGVGGDLDFSVARSGTWTGTLTLQRSLDGRDSGFIDTAETYTTNGSGVFSPGTDYNNTVHYYRVGFKSGDYTSGTAVVTLSANADSGSGVCRVVGYSSATSVSVEVLSGFKNTLATDNWLEGEWSDYRGWPSAAVMHDGRLWWGRGGQFWGSESDNFVGFSLDTEGDSRSIQRSIATGATSVIRWMLSLQRLIFGTKASEVSARSSAFDAPLTAEETTLKDASTQGVAPLSPVKVDTYGLYIQRSLKRIYQIFFESADSDYTSDDLTRLNEDISGTGGFVELAVQRQPDTYVWAIRTDGQAGVLLLQRKEEVAGWFRIITDGEIESICVLPGDDQDNVYLSVKRTINSGTVRYIEKLAPVTSARGGASNLMADSYVTAAGPATSITAAHLLNETGLIAWATNSDGDHVALTGLSANGSGVISLGGTYTNIVAGLPYDWRLKTAKLAYGAQAGTALLQKKKVSSLGLLLENTHPDAISFGPDFTNMDPMPRTEDGEAVDTNTLHTVYDEMTFTFPGGWDTDSRICLKGSAPYPATINAIVMIVETNEKV